MGRSSAAEKVEVGDFTKKNGDKLGYIGYIGISGIVYIYTYIYISADPGRRKGERARE
jgi:hypothetical protein